MSDTSTGLPTTDPIVSRKKFWTNSPREIVFRYIRFLPWVILSIVLFLVVAYIKIRYTTQIFKAQASLLIKNESNSGGSSGGSKDERFDELFMAQGTTNISNEVEVIRSRPVLQRVIRDLGLQKLYYNAGKVKSSLLYPQTPITLDLLDAPDSIQGFACQIILLDDTKFMLGKDKTVFRFGQVLEKGGCHFLILRNPDLPLHSFGSMEFDITWLPMPVIVESLIGGLKVVQANEQATILTLTYESENVKLSKDILNMLMAVYDTLVVEDKRRIASSTLRFINQSITELNDTLRGVQGGLKDFMVKNQVFDIEGQSKSYLENKGESSKQKGEFEVKLGIVNFLLQYISDKKNEHELVPTNLGIEEPALLQLVAEYNRLQLERENNAKTTSESNPLIVGMDNTLGKIRSDIYQALLNVRQAYGIASQNLSKKDDELQEQITSLPGKSMQLLNIEQRQKILEDLYSLLLQKRLEISLSSVSTISNSTVVEPAIGSGTPTSPDKKKIYTLSFLLGLLFPIGIIALSEILRDKVGSRADVEKQTSAPILGEIGHSENDQVLVVTQNSRRLIAEQFRIIRTNLQYMIGKNERPVIMITSSFSGEGKSFISTNMGAVLALSGKKTVIMEFDIRKPKIISGLDLKRKMGITNYIIGKATFQDLLVKVEGVEDLYVIPCGPIPPNPAEILLDKKLEELMAEVKAHFEVVIMDTAPVGLVSDATNLGIYADCTMYIVRQGHTYRRQVNFIDDLYVNKKLPGLCLLINDIKAKDGYYGGYYGGGGYGYYAGYSYGVASGYFEDDNRKGGIKKNIFGRFILWVKRLFS